MVRTLVFSLTFIACILEGIPALPQSEPSILDDVKRFVGGIKDDLYDDDKETTMIKFKAGEGFVFKVPNSMVEYSPQKKGKIWEDGQSWIVFDHDKNPKTPNRMLIIPKRLLRIRQAILKADIYFKAELVKAKIPVSILDKMKPIDVYIISSSKMDSDDLGQVISSKFTSHVKIRILQDVHSDELEKVVIHEYFHVIQNVLFKKAFGMEPAKQVLFDHNSSYFFDKFLAEMTADWASDEPILIPQPDGKILNADNINKYVQPLIVDIFFDQNRVLQSWIQVFFPK